MTIFDPARRAMSRRAMLQHMAAASAALAVVPSRVLAQAPASQSVTTALPARGEYLIRNALVLTMDAKLGDLPKGDIHVRDGAIVAVGPSLQAAGATVIDATNMIALPGLIDTHWHMWGSVARNMAGEDSKTGYFLFARAVGDVFTPEDNARGVRLSLAEAIHSGITTVHNWAHNLPKPEFADAELQAHVDFGGRALYGYGYAGVGMTNQPINLADLPRVQKQWFGDRSGLLTLGIASRGPESNSAEICKREWDTARQLGLRISTHIGTGMARVKQSQGVKALAEAGLLGPDVILVHDTNYLPEDLEPLAKTGTHISMSPYTEMRTGFGFPPIQPMLDKGINICLSVDTTVLAGNCDMFAIMKAMQNVANGAKQSEFALSPRRVLEMATIDGARALGIEDRVGTLTPGKRADIVLVRMDDLNMAPFTDGVRMIVQAAQPANVDTVLIDGRILKRGGRLQHIDTAKIMADATETMGRVRVGVEKVLERSGVSVVR
ncbi:MAG: amidohydrolase family protein [Rhizobiales bacterium]|nr:amidohydrolase family protein [Hyphomicrobiales bacterium]